MLLLLCGCRIVLRRHPELDCDITLMGRVVWTGRSSMVINMRQARPSMRVDVFGRFHFLSDFGYRTAVVPLNILPEFHLYVATRSHGVSLSWCSGWRLCWTSSTRHFSTMPVHSSTLPVVRRSHATQRTHHARVGPSLCADVLPLAVR